MLDFSTTPEGVIDYIYTSCADQIETIVEGGETIDYSYNGNLITGINYSGSLNQSITQSYNNEFRLNGLAYAGGTAAISYDGDGFITQANGYTLVPNEDNGLPDQVTDSVYDQSRTYTLYGELDVNSIQVNGQNRYSYDLDYNDLGQIVTKNETLHDGTVNTFVYAYHPDRDWLMTVSKNGVLVEDYDYDLNGNRESYRSILIGNNGLNATFNNADQLLTSDNLGTSYQYTADGYLEKKVEGILETSYQYNSRGQLKSVTTPTQTVSYEHNAIGNRVVKRINGAIVEKYLWLDKTTLLATYDASDNLKQRFEYSLGQTPTSYTLAGQKYYIVSDHLGSPRVITDSSGNVLKAIEYDSYGNQISDSNPSLEIPFGFAGGLHDKDTGLIRFGFRDYDPSNGRWTARDPIGFEGDDTNLYSYVFNEPINFIDLTGQIACGGACVLAAGFLAGLALDAAVNAISGADGSALSAGVNGTVGAATASTLPTQKKPRTGVSGGGPSGDGTTLASQANHRAYRKGQISLAQRHRLTKLLRKIPYLGTGIGVSQLLKALYDRFGKEVVDQALNDALKEELNNTCEG